MKHQLFCVSTFLLIIHAALAEDRLSAERSFAENRYMREKNQYSDLTYGRRLKRQSQSTYNSTYFVTQCNHNNTSPTDGPYIRVTGVDLQNEHVALKAAKLIHLMVRFMSRPIFTRLANNSVVGLYPMSKLPSSAFQEFKKQVPQSCESNCGVRTLANGSQYDCSRWCTSSDYPFSTNRYPINYLWAYGNFSMTYVIETNVQCEGFNPFPDENLLIREFGLTVMIQALDNNTRRNIAKAFSNANEINVWGRQFKNDYEYFGRATQVWFDGVRNSMTLGGMACMNMIDPQTGLPMCKDSFDQRQNIKDIDPELYRILNLVYNNEREYLNGDTSTCMW